MPGIYIPWSQLSKRPNADNVILGSNPRIADAKGNQDGDSGSEMVEKRNRQRLVRIRQECDKNFTAYTPKQDNAYEVRVI